MLPFIFSRSRSRSIPTCPRKSPRPTAQRRTKRTMKDQRRPPRASSSNYQQSCCSKIDVAIRMYIDLTCFIPDNALRRPLFLGRHGSFLKNGYRSRTPTLPSPQRDSYFSSLLPYHRNLRFCQTLLFLLPSPSDFSITFSLQTWQRSSVGASSAGSTDRPAACKDCQFADRAGQSVLVSTLTSTLATARPAELHSNW